MSKKIDEQTVKKIAMLAKIELTEKEVSLFSDQLSSILGYVEKLNEVDTGEEKYVSHVDIQNVMREDEVEGGLSNDDAIGQARNRDGYIVVPAVFN